MMYGASLNTKNTVSIQQHPPSPTDPGKTKNTKIRKINIQYFICGDIFT